MKRSGGSRWLVRWMAVICGMSLGGSSGCALEEALLDGFYGGITEVVTSLITRPILDED